MQKDQPSDKDKQEATSVQPALVQEKVENERKEDTRETEKQARKDKWRKLMELGQPLWEEVDRKLKLLQVHLGNQTRTHANGNFISKAITFIYNWWFGIETSIEQILNRIEQLEDQIKVHEKRFNALEIRASRMERKVKRIFQIVFPGSDIVPA